MECSGGDDSPCREPSTCDADGQCVPGEMKPAGARCSEATDCASAGQCDGFGGCRQLAVLDGTPCTDLDGDVCTENACSGGLCQTAGPNQPTYEAGFCSREDCDTVLACGFSCDACAVNECAPDETAPTVICDLGAMIIRTSALSGACEASLDVSATAEDVCDGALAASCSTSELFLSEPGIVVASCDATDGAGNAGASCTTRLELIDNTPPVIAGLAQGGIEYVVGDCGGGPIDLGALVSDNCPGDVEITCTTVAGDSFGGNAVDCVATDESGNSATRSFTVVVLEPLQVVFQSPLADDNAADDYAMDADAINKLKAGSVVPHKVKLFNCLAEDVTVAADVTVKLDVTKRKGASETSTLIQDVTETYSGVGDTGNLMVLTDDHYHFNVNTRGWDANTLASDFYFQSVVSVSYPIAPALAVGSEDARLESKK